MTSKRLLTLIIAAFFATISTIALAFEICRQNSFAGLDSLTTDIHAIIGSDTKNRHEIKIFVSKVHDKLYLQSNFLSNDPDNPKLYSEFPTKILSNGIHDMRSALANTIFWSKLPPNWEDIVDDTLASTEVIIDENLLRDEKLPIDLTGIVNIRIASIKKRQNILTGKISLIDTGNPPPDMMELLDGCCLHGRPPLTGKQLLGDFAKQKIDNNSISLFNFVTDSATESFIQDSKLLKSIASKNSVNLGNDPGEALRASMKSASTKTLIMVTHIEDGSVVLLDASGNSRYSISIENISKMAKDNDVNLILFGCETANIDTDLNVGILGKYNTHYAVQQIEKSLANSKNSAEFLKGVATDKLTVVLSQPKEDLMPTKRADIYAQDSEGLLSRIYRILFLGARNG